MKFLPVSLPPRLPALGLPLVKPALQHRRARIVAQHEIELHVAEILLCQFVQRAKILPQWPAEPKVFRVRSYRSLQAMRLHEIGELFVVNDQPKITARWHQRSRNRPDQCGNRAWIADRPERKDQPTHFKIARRFVEFGAKLRHRGGADLHQLSHEHAPEFGVVDRVIEFVEFPDDLSRSVARIGRQGRDDFSGGGEFFGRGRFGRDEHEVGRRFALFHDHRWLRERVESRAVAAGVDEKWKILARSGAHRKSAFGINCYLRYRRKIPSPRRLQRTKQPDFDPLAVVLIDGDRQAGFRIHNLASNKSTTN